MARTIGIAGAAIRRMPIPSKVLQAGLKDPVSQGRTIAAIGELGLSDMLPAIREFLFHPELALRADAAWAVARMSSDRAALGELQGIAVVETSHRQRSATMAVRKLEPGAARRWVEMLANIPGCERTAIHAIGALGDPALVPMLIEKLDVPELARPTAEAFSLITGANLAAEKLEAPAKEDVEAVPCDDPRDPRVSLDPDNDLDWPHPAKIRKWWNANQSRFAKGKRHLCGKPIAVEQLQHVLKSGFQRQRAAAAMELAILRPRDPIFEVWG